MSLQAAKRMMSQSHCTAKMAQAIVARCIELADEEAAAQKKLGSDAGRIAATMVAARIAREFRAEGK